MFGAYQAGAWKALHDRVKPDLVIGASAGALNGWAIAGGASPDTLIERWLHPGAGLLRFGQPAIFENGVREIFEAFRPRIGYRAAITEMPRFRPCTVDGSRLTWRHLAASCAIPLLAPMPRIDGRLYADGGLVRALPLWAVAGEDIQRVIAVDALAHPPSAALRAVLGALRALIRVPRPGPQMELRIISPPRALGTLRDAMVWRRANAERWIEQGAADARHAADDVFPSKFVILRQA